MRIAMFTNNYKPYVAGVPISVERLSESLRSLGHEVYIFAPDYGVPETDPFVIRCRTHSGRLKGDAAVPHCFDRQAEKRFRSLSVDAIHVHHPMMLGFFGLYLGKKYNIPVAFTYHTRYEEYLHYVPALGYLRQAPAPLSSCFSLLQETLVPKGITAFANQCSLVFAPTPSMKEHLLASGVHRPVQILPTGLTDRFYRRDLAKSAALRRKYAGEKGFLFCTAARLGKEKNLSFLLRAAAHLKEHFSTDFRLLVLGDGPEKDALQKERDALFLKDHVIFTGAIPNEELMHYHNACDAFLFASKSETQGIVLLEAMAGQSPVIALSAPGVSDVVKDGYNGFLTEEEEGAFAEAVFHCMQDADLLTRLQSGAWSTALSYRSSILSRNAEASYAAMQNCAILSIAN